MFWDGSRSAAMAYDRVIDDDTLDFTAESGQIRDMQTGSVWLIDGTAISGPMSGRRLTAVADAFVSFWFAWNAFYPEAVLWSDQ